MKPPARKPRICAQCAAKYHHETTGRYCSYTCRQTATITKRGIVVVKPQKRYL